MGNEFIQKVPFFRFLPIPEKVVGKIFLPKDKSSRARKVVRRSNYGHVIKFASTKCNRIVELESLLEYDRAILLETDTNVVMFQEQPFQLKYSDEGKVHSIYPDLLVERRDGSLTVEEVKPAEKAMQPKMRRRFSVEKKLLEKKGFQFAVLTENEIRIQPRLANAKKLLPYRRLDINALIRESVLHKLRSGPATGFVLLKKTKGLSEESLFALVAKGHVFVDHSKPLLLASTFYIASNDSEERSSNVWEKMKELLRKLVQRDQ